MEKESVQYQETLELLRKMIKAETNFLSTYNMLLNKIDDEETTYILKKILADTGENIEILKSIFLELTNTNINTTRSIYIENRSIQENYIDNLKNSLFDTLEAIKLYTQLLQKIENHTMHNMILQVIMNKVIHADLFNYLITQTLHQ